MSCIYWTWFDNCNIQTSGEAATVGSSLGWSLVSIPGRVLSTVRAWSSQPRMNFCLRLQGRWSCQWAPSPGVALRDPAGGEHPTPDKIAIQNSGTTSAHLKFIQKGLFDYFPPINALSKQKRVMRRAMRKPQYLPFKRFAAWLTELKNYLPLFPGSTASKNMPPKEPNEILLHAVFNVWEKQAYIQGYYF